MKRSGSRKQDLLIMMKMRLLKLDWADDEKTINKNRWDRMTIPQLEKEWKLLQNF